VLINKQQRFPQRVRNCIESGKTKVLYGRDTSAQGTGLIYCNQLIYNLLGITPKSDAFTLIELVGHAFHSERNDLIGFAKAAFSAWLLLAIIAVANAINPA
jgi:hypothetical protein